MRFYYVLFLIIVIHPVFGQERFFDAGLHAGVNFSQVDGDHLGGYNKTGLLVGFHIGHQYSKKLHTRMELNYTQKGSKRRLDPEDPNPQIFILAFHYIEMPLIASYAFEKFKLNGGLSIGNNISAKRDEGFGFRDASIKPWETALHAGASFELDDQFEVEMRHSTSIFRVGDAYPNGLNIWNRIGLYNRVWSLTMHYKLGKN